MAASDPVETQTPIFTEGEVYMIGGFLAERWSSFRTLDEEVDDIGEAIKAVLSYGR